MEEKRRVVLARSGPRLCVAMKGCGGRSVSARLQLASYLLQPCFHPWTGFRQLLGAIRDARLKGEATHFDGHLLLLLVQHLHLPFLPRYIEFLYEISLGGLVQFPRDAHGFRRRVSCQPNFKAA